MTAALATGCATTTAANDPKRWVVGCFNRPWSRLTYDEALSGTREAGYKVTGLLTPHPKDAFLSPNSSVEYVDGLATRMQKEHLKCNMTSLRFSGAAPYAQSLESLQKQLDYAGRLNLQYAMTFGVDKPDHFETFYLLMSELAPYAEARKVQLVMKPHGGNTGASEEILRCMGKVNHPNFRVWYDAGNIIHYTGKDPIEELKPVVKYVSGFCAKDCAKKASDVMIQFGTGAVDFKGVFRTLKAGGFNGPIMVEGCAGKAYAEITANARENRLFLERTLAEV